MRPVSWRPSSITPEKIRKIRRLAAEGISFKTIAYRCRTSVTSVRQYADPDYSDTHQQQQETRENVFVPTTNNILGMTTLPELTEAPLVSEVVHVPVVVERAPAAKSKMSVGEKVWIFVIVFVAGAFVAAVLNWTFGTIGIFGVICCVIAAVVVIRALK